MAMVDADMKRGMLVMPVKKMYQYGKDRQFALEEAGETLLRLRIGDAVGYLDGKSGVLVWPPEE
jgi:hypothetical protein